jgi:SAM-dependent methyltransferase
MNRFHRWYCRTDRWRGTLQGRIVPWVLRGVELGRDALEIGPGPGLATDVLEQRVQHLTAIEIDPALADALRERKAGSNVEVIGGDATRLPFPAASFDSVVCFTMLHHVPSAALQDRLFAEAHRVLAPGGTFAGSDSRSSLLFRLAHVADTMVLVDSTTLRARLERAGFTEVVVDAASSAFRFRARRASLGDAIVRE